MKNLAQGISIFLVGSGVSVLSLFVVMLITAKIYGDDSEEVWTMAMLGGCVMLLVSATSGIIGLFTAIGGTGGGFRVPTSGKDCLQCGYVLGDATETCPSCGKAIPNQSAAHEDD